MIAKGLFKGRILSDREPRPPAMHLNACHRARLYRAAQEAIADLDSSWSRPEARMYGRITDNSPSPGRCVALAARGTRAYARSRSRPMQDESAVCQVGRGRNIGR
jgi:hypothetical protein